MSFLTSEIKKPLYWGLAWIFTFINFVTFIVSRNEFWLTHPGQAWLAASATEDRTYLASEFERDLSCYQPQTCLRSGASFVSQTLIDLTTAVTQLVTVNLNNDQRIFIILLFGLLWRALCLLIFFAAMKSLFSSSKAALTAINILMIVLGGLPLWLVGRFILNLPFAFDETLYNRISDAIYWMSFQDLMFYDYGFVAIIPLTVLLLSKDSQFLRLSSPSYLLIGFVTATFYEVFVPLIVVATAIFLWRTTRKINFKLLWMFLGQVIWICTRAYSVRFLEPSDPNSIYFRDTSFVEVLKIFRLDGIDTPSSSRGSILVQYLLITAVAATVAIIGCLLTNLRTNFRSFYSNQTSLAISSVLIPTILIIIGTYFSPRLVEVGRQSIGLTVAVVIYSFAATQNFLAKAQAKRSTASSDSV
jgi:hypothetical protein